MSMLRQCGTLGAVRSTAAYTTTTLLQRQTALYALAIGAKREHHLLLRQSWAKMGLTSTLAAAATAPTLADFAQRGHKKFGHAKEVTPRLTKYFHAFIMTLFLVAVLDFRKLKKAIMPKVDADVGPQDDINYRFKKAKDANDDIDKDDNEENYECPKLTTPGKEKQGFRERKIIEYENRIRQYSTPDKIFRYFATVRLTTPQGSEICMTPDDFLRSIYPGVMQPQGLGLDQYRRYDPKSATECLELNLEKNSIFYKLGSYGLITFSDYIFLLTVLSTSRRHFEIAFQMFDLNGDGDVDCEEFEQVANLVRQQTSMGNRHRDHAATGNTFKGVNSALTTYFFGKNLNEKLKIEKFINFQTQLQREILSLEFQRKIPNEKGLITEVDFAELLVAYAGYSIKKKTRKLKRVKRKFRENSIGISREDYLDFFHFLSNINDVDTALTFYHIAGASIDQNTLKHVAKTVAMVNLRDHVVDVIFTIFDEDNDDQLSNREFVAVMKNRLMRGLEKAKDTGFLKLMRGIFKCAKDTKPVLLDI